MRGVDRAAIIGALTLCLLGLFFIVTYDALNRPPPKYQNQWLSEAQSNAQLVTPPTPVAPDQTHAEPQAPGPHSTKEPVPHDWISEFFQIKLTDLLIAFFTGVLAVKTADLFRETSGLRNAADKQSTDMQASIKAAVDSAKAAITSNQIAVANAEQQLRAYVTVQEVQMLIHRHPDRVSTSVAQLVPGNPHTYRFSIVLKNGGATPAINARINVSCEKFNGGIPADFVFPSSQLFGDALIGPQVIWNTPSVTVSAAEMENPAVPTARYLWGWIEYDDIFPGSIRHRTEFCFQIIFERLAPTNEGYIRFEAHSRFNAADWDCLRPIDPATGEGGD
jgi:hypothetical protein